MLKDQEFKDFLKALGTRIRQIRKAKGLDMRDIMIASGYYDAQWRKYEAGGSMNVASLMRVALALDVSLVELFDGLGQRPKSSVEDIEGQKSEDLKPVLPSGKSTQQDNASDLPSIVKEKAQKNARTATSTSRRTKK